LSIVKVQGNASGTGIFTIAAPNGNTDRTLTLPDNTGTILTTGTAGVPVNGPAFSAYASSAQSVNHNTATKIAFQTEEFDTNSCYDNATNYRFTPTVAGYYQVNAGINWGGWTSTYTFVMVFKNGSEIKRGSSVPNNAVGLNNTISCLVYLNGSTDYVEIYGQHNNGSAQNTSAFGAPAVFFQASLVRAA
jgi:hypothetical protein